MVERVRHSFPAWRIFILGAEITDDVTACNANYHDDRAPNTAEFVLASPLDRYVTTPTDIHALYDDISVDSLDPKQLEDSSSDVEDQLRSRIERTITDPVKRTVLLAKVAERVKGIVQPSLPDGLVERRIESATQGVTSSQHVSLSPLEFNELRGEVARFPFQVGQTIFHAGDPVRIFWRNPFNPSEWFFAATGVVSDSKESVDVNHKRTVTITVEDALRMFRLSRFSTNWALFDIDAVSDSLFDSLLRTWHQDHFSDLTLPEILYSMTFGVEAAGVRSKIVGAPAGEDFVGPPDSGQLTESFGGIGDKPLNQFYYGIFGKTPMKTRLHGAGLFNLEESRIFEIGPIEKDAQTTTTLVSDPIESLEAWQKQIDHVVPTDIDEVLTMCLPELRSEERVVLAALAAENDGTLRVEDVIGVIGSHPERYPVDFGRLMLLMPASLGPGTNRDILLRDLVQNVATQTEFSSRLAIIYDICRRIDFSFYATPRGDIVCEMPLYSFRPEDFGVYGDRYRFPIIDTIASESIFSDEKVKTLFVVDYWLIENFKTINKASHAYQPPGTAALRALVPQFGVRAETVDPWGYINSREEASYYGNIKLSQLNADAWMVHIETIMRTGLGPNRPCWFECRDFIATLRGENSSISWGMNGGVTQTLKLNYRRGWSGQITDKGSHVYESFGGRMSQPVDYSMFFQNETNQSTTSTKELAPVDTQAPALASVIQTSDSLAKNIAFMKAQMTIVALTLSATSGKHVEADDLMGSFVRTPNENRLDGGTEHSKHLEGLAVDIPNSKLQALNTRLGTNFTHDQIAADMNALIALGPNDGGIASGVVLWRGYANPRLAAEHTDHVHYEIHVSRDIVTAWNDR